MSQPVIGIHKETGERISFKKMKEAADKFGINTGNLVRACKVPEWTAGGYYWRYGKLDKKGEVVEC